MAKLPEDHPMSAHKDVVGQTMHRWKHHDPKPLHSGRGKGGKVGKVVKSQEQAIAIALSMAGESKEDGKGKGKKKSKGSKTSNHAERLVSLGYSENTAQAVSEMLEDSLDFTRCQRPDGSAYGTSGQCRKGVEKALSIQEKLADLYNREVKARSEGDMDTARKLMREHMSLSRQLDSQVSAVPSRSKRAQDKMKQITAETNPQRQEKLIRELEEINNPLVKLPGGRVAREWGVKSPYEF